MNNYPPHYAYPSAPPLVRAKPNPPRLHWGWVLVLSVITVGLFGMIWMLVQSVWVRKVNGRKAPMVWSIAYLAFIPVIMILVFGMGMVLALQDRISALGQMTDAIGDMARVIGFVVYIACAYTLKGALESEPINIPLSGIMTFFFAPIYFQYQLNDFIKAGMTPTQGLRLGGGPVIPIVSTESDVR